MVLYFGISVFGDYVCACMRVDRMYAYIRCMFAILTCLAYVLAWPGAYVIAW